jgi:hypothetical protein
MSAQHASITRTARLALLLLVAGVLAAGCGSVSAGSSAVAGGSPAASGTSGTPAAASGTSGAPAASGSPASGGAVPATATPAASAAPVPTVSGGSAAAGEANCAGWPSGAVSGPLPASFVPVSVERCANGVTAVSGKGLWTSATLERSTGDLSRLLTALREPAATRRPGTVCPALAMIPPRIVLVNAAGEKLIPQLPAGDCGLTSGAVLTALDELSWQPVSVRLIARISGGANETMPAPSVGTPSAGAPQPTQKPSGGHLHP